MVEERFVDSVKQLAEIQSDMASKLASLAERIRNLEARPQASDTDALRAMSGDIQQLSSQMSQLSSRIGAAEAATLDKSAMATISSRLDDLVASMDTLRTYGEKIRQLETTINTMRTDFTAQTDGSINALNNNMAALRSELATRTETLNKELEIVRAKSAIPDSVVVRLTQQRVDQVARGLEERINESMHAVAALAANMEKENQERLAKLTDRYEASFSQIEKRFRDAADGVEQRVRLELKSEMETMRTGILENIIELRDRMKHAEIVEDNLASKVDAKLNEASKKISQMFDDSNRRMRDELADMFAREVGEVRAVMDKYAKESVATRESLNTMAVDVDRLKFQVSELLAKKKMEDDEIMKNIELLEQRLRVK